MSVRPNGLNDDMSVRVLIDHTTPPSEYHQWVWVGEWIGMDINGVSRRGDGPEAWAKVVCNSPECAGTAYVNPARVVMLAVEIDGVRA